MVSITKRLNSKFSQVCPTLRNLHATPEHQSTAITCQFKHAVMRRSRARQRIRARGRSPGRARDSRKRASRGRGGRLAPAVPRGHREIARAISRETENRKVGREMRAVTRSRRRYVRETGCAARRQSGAAPSRDRDETRRAIGGRARRPPIATRLTAGRRPPGRAVGALRHSVT